MKLRHSLISGLLLGSVSVTAVANTQELQFNRGWIKQLPPTIPVRAGYLHIANPSKLAHQIDRIESAAFETVEMHETIQTNNVLSMQQLQTIAVPAGQSVELKPGGKHLMLSNPLQPLKLGDKIEITLFFADGSSQKTLLEVRQ